MREEDKIFGLIAQAEDIQKHAVALQRSAQDAIKTLPEASRAAIRDAAREFITEGAERASKGLLDASSEAKATATALRRTGLMQGVFLVAVAVVIAGGAYFAMRFIGARELAQLQELKEQIKAERVILSELQSKTWGLELVNYSDGGRGIILPRGTTFSRAAKIENGRTAIIINP